MKAPITDFILNCFQLSWTDTLWSKFFMHYSEPGTNKTAIKSSNPTCQTFCEVSGYQTQFDQNVVVSRNTEIRWNYSFNSLTAVEFCVTVGFDDHAPWIGIGNERTFNPYPYHMHVREPSAGRGAWCLNHYLGRFGIKACGRSNHSKAWCCYDLNLSDPAFRVTYRIWRYGPWQWMTTGDPLLGTSNVYQSMPTHTAVVKSRRIRSINSIKEENLNPWADNTHVSLLKSFSGNLGLTEC